MSDDRTTKAELWHTALVEIIDHWGEPMSLGTDPQILLRKWMREYYTLKNIARAALGEPLLSLPRVEDGHV